MKPKYYHKPNVSLPGRVRCPICKEAVYSPAGIHPQCAMLHPDAPGEGWGVFDQFVPDPRAMSEDQTPADRDGG